MLPKLHSQKGIDSVVNNFLQQLSNSAFSGDIESQLSSRIIVATDNSIYQQLPQAIIFPKSTDDVVLIGEISAQPEFKAVTFSPRGGGTGTNGQSLTKGVVVDLSRYMNQILEINEDEGWARVQAGVIKDQLNDAVRPYGYFFSPDLSTSNRATLGGMINTDASGQGSLKYGKTSDHILSLRAVFADGSQYETDGSQDQPETSSLAATALRVAEAVCRNKRAEIVAKFPSLNRFLTGYDLKNPFDEEQDSFNFTRILCGSEGSLAFITEAKLNLTPIPAFRSLVNIKYNSFDSALRNAPFMLDVNALSVETMDSTVLNLAKQDIIWHSVNEFLDDVSNKVMDGINIVEFAGYDQQLVEQQVLALTNQLDQMQLNEEAGIIGYQVCHDLDSINRIYAMRKKAVGLLGATKGSKKPLPFAEDTCVPPENLADFIAEFRTLLDHWQLKYGMFGHVDAGVLHVRPMLDMNDPQQEQVLHEVSDEVVKLVAKYGGLMWGEHGKGYRSEYGPEFFGESLFTELRRIKTAFDPDNKMNPGKICTPLESDAELVTVRDRKRGYFDRQIDVLVRASFKQAMECNGNGLCFNYDQSSPMCPSMRVTADRRHSPKGRAMLMREWLRQLAEQGIDILALEQQTLTQTPTLKTWVALIKNKFRKQDDTDFSHEVYEAMNGCLACKACATQCPIRVDVPDFRARFLNLYHTRYPRPVKDYLVANIESLLPLMAKSPSLINTVMASQWMQTATASTVGYIDTPLLSDPTLAKRLDAKVQSFDMAYLSQLSVEQRNQYVVIVQDPFTSYYEADVVDDFVQLVIKLGKNPILLPFKPNGKAQHIKGFLKQFASTARNTAAFLSRVAALNIPMVGVDPALVLCYRDEYKDILGDNRGEFNVLTVHEWLLPRLNEFVFNRMVLKDTLVTDQGDIDHKNKHSLHPWYLFAHCTEKTKLPNAEKEWGAIFTHFGATLKTIPVGCCGMAGTFGHERDKFELSKGIYDLSWETKLSELPQERCLVTGYSCRSQVKRFEQIKPKHPLQALLTLI